MKKNLLFAIGVFLITIAGLLVFSQSSKKTSKETTKLETVNKSNQDKITSIK